MDQGYINLIRNFSIIAHIDHGKSTLADRLLEFTGTINKREMKDRVLDTLELEQERGITIKLQTARMLHLYTGKSKEFLDDQAYVLNLIDTPGHVDFSYEVSRSLAASEGAILLVDATQGIQAQTLTTVYKALEYDLQIIPVINKVDLPSAEVENVKLELMSTFGFEESEILEASGKTGLGVEGLLNRIIERFSPPKPIYDDEQAPKFLIYDSFYHGHKGVILLVKSQQGDIEQTDTIYSLGTKNSVIPLELGYITPNLVKQNMIRAGEVGYIATGMKDIKMFHVGDTITLEKFKTFNPKALPGYLQPKPMVYATLFPVDATDFKEFAEALEKLALNDAALTYERQNSQALGSGYLCGFLGLLHLEITGERLEKEFDLDLISTSPSVDYKIWLTTTDMGKVPNINIANKNPDGSFNIKTANEFPDRSLIAKIQEPWVRLEILAPDEYIGGLMDLAQKHRAVYKKMEYINTESLINSKKHVLLKYEIPTAEIITNFFDTLKSISQGYASMDYEFIEYRESDIVKVDILVNYESAGALSFLTHSEHAERRGKELVDKLKDLIPRHQFKIPLQAAIGSKVISRETIQAFRKDVTAKLYGGDVTRKMKLLEKQKKGKKKLKMYGNVEIPKQAFLQALKID